MPELIQVNEDVYYLSDHMNYGVVKVGHDKAVVIDTGLNDDSAQMILAALESEHLELAAIINTHSHADHYGGNNHLVERTGCAVYAPSLEAAIMANPSLESFYIYGAYPPEELRQPFLKARVSPVDVIIEEPNIAIGDKDFGIVSLKGHSPNQIGVIVDDIFFCGDSIFSKGAWQKFILVYAINIDDMIKSIERLKLTRAKSFIPSHATPTGDITELADFNLTRIQAISDDILHVLETPAETDTVLWEISKQYGLAIKTLQQYYLTLDTLKAYLSYLLQEGLIAYEFDANRLMWLARG